MTESDSTQRPTPAWRREYLSEIDSTNLELLRRASQGELPGLVLVADHQTAGRGRLGRTWQAPAKSSLLVSVLLKPGIAQADLGLVPIASGLALAQALENSAPFKPGLVWPNDVFGARGKIAGILVESVFEQAELQCLVIGAGVNLLQKKGDFSPEIRRRASSLWEETGKKVGREELLENYLEKLGYWLGVVERGGAEAVVEKYGGYDIIAGSEVRLLQEGREIFAVARGIDAKGRLRAEVSGSEKSFGAGEIIQIRRSSDAAGD